MTLHTEPVTVNIGPHHPSTHGVFRMRVTFDGENVQDVEPVIGYLHRGTEKLAEERQYTQAVSAGKATSTARPPLGRFARLSRPPCASTISRHKGRPKPVPVCFVE